MIVYVLTLGRPVLAAMMAVIVGAWCRGDPPSTAAAIVLVALGLAEETSDVLDGILARRLGVASRLGGILDPMADSLARLTIYFAFGLAGWLSIAVPLVMVARDVVVGYCRVACGIAGMRTSARLSGKAKAIVQGAGIFAVVVAAWLAATGSHDRTVGVMRIVIAAITIGVTAWSLADYVRNALPAMRKVKDMPNP